MFVEGGPAQIPLDEKHFRAELRDNDSQVDGEKSFSFALDRAGQENAASGFVVGGKADHGSDILERFPGHRLRPGQEALEPDRGIPIKTDGAGNRSQECQPKLLFQILLGMDGLVDAL